MFQVTISYALKDNAQNAGGSAPDFSSIPVPQYDATFKGGPSRGNPFQSSLEAFINNFDKFGDKLTEEGQKEGNAEEVTKKGGQDPPGHSVIPSRRPPTIDHRPGRDRGRRPHSKPKLDKDESQQVSDDTKRPQDSPIPRPGDPRFSALQGDPRYETYPGPDYHSSHNQGPGDYRNVAPSDGRPLSGPKPPEQAFGQPTRVDGVPIHVTEKGEPSYYPWQTQAEGTKPQHQQDADLSPEAFNPYSSIAKPLKVVAENEQHNPNKAAEGKKGSGQKQDYPSRDYDYFDPYAKQPRREPPGGLYDPFDEPPPNYDNPPQGGFYNPYPEEKPHPDQVPGDYFNPYTEEPPGGYRKPEEGRVYSDAKNGEGTYAPYSISGHGGNDEGNIVTGIYKKSLPEISVHFQKTFQHPSSIY